MGEGSQTSLGPCPREVCQVSLRREETLDPRGGFTRPTSAAPIPAITPADAGPLHPSSRWATPARPDSRAASSTPTRTDLSLGLSPAGGTGHAARNHRRGTRPHRAGTSPGSRLGAERSHEAPALHGNREQETPLRLLPRDDLTIPARDSSHRRRRPPPPSLKECWSAQQGVSVAAAHPEAMDAGAVRQPQLRHYRPAAMGGDHARL